MSRIRCVVMLLAVAMVLPDPLYSQVVDTGSRVPPDSLGVGSELGFTLIGARPVGEFADYVGPGGGFSLFGVLNLGDRKSVGLRLDLDLVTYGSNTVRVPLSPTVPFVDVDVTTENSISSLSLGPQLVLGQKRVRPFLHGSVGVSQLVTTTSVWSSGDLVPLASSQNYEDHVFMLSAGGGIRIVAAAWAGRPFGLEIGGHYVRRGVADYLREGGLQAAQGGETVLDPIRSETNLITYHLGMTLGFH